MKTETKKTANMEGNGHFIHKIIEADIASGNVTGQIVTRFPPEPNGWLHIGHAKSIFLNWGLAEKYAGIFNLRFDDTNPEAEDVKYMEAIKQDIQWLGVNWEDRLFFASDYFAELYEMAEQLIKAGKAYVCSLNANELKEYRGTLTRPGVPSPSRDNSVDENLSLFRSMKEGEFKDGEKVLRAKIDMTSANMNMRDPAIYRIRQVSHPRTGSTWKIYPLYDFTHCLSDSIEGITHSVCTLEFEDHRPLYEWVLNTLDRPCKPKQIEFARLNLEHTILSKRYLLKLVNEKHVNGWDDPRMPTLSGMRRRGVLPHSIREFCDRIGVTKKGSSISMSTFEACVRESLDPVAIRRMVVLKPLKIIITNYQETGQPEMISARSHPKDESFGRRSLRMSKEIFIEQDDFMEDPPKKYFRLAPGREVRLRNSYVVRCDEVVRDSKSGEVIELKCTYDPKTIGGKQPEGRKVKGIVHWVSANYSKAVTVRLFDRLLRVKDAMSKEQSRDTGGDGVALGSAGEAISDREEFIKNLNPDSMIELKNARAEWDILAAKMDDRFQFERVGYFCLDKVQADGPLVFNRIISLKDSWGD